MKLKLIQLLDILSYLPNPLETARNLNYGPPDRYVPIRVRVMYLKEPVTDNIIMQWIITPDKSHIQKSNLANVEEIEFILNIHSGFIPFWEPVENIYIKPYEKPTEKL